MKKIPFITLERLLEMKANDEAFTLVDALSAEHFAAGHIPGAVNIPSDSIMQKAEGAIDPGKPVVTYCTNYACPVSTLAARKLLDSGFTDVFDFKGGVKVWTDAGLDLEQ